MELKVTTLEGKEAGSVQLSDEIFGLEPRKDIIQRCVNWQLAKRQAGTHKTQGRADVWRTGKKMYKQKGTGGARHGSARVPQFRGGGRAFGPVVRSHAFALPKKVRALALRHALSAKALVLAASSVADSITIRPPSLALADSAWRSASARTFFGSANACERTTGPNARPPPRNCGTRAEPRSEEHTSELQSL